MQVLITGGAGFIGAWVAIRLLQRGDSVRSLDLAPPTAAVQTVLGEHAASIDWVKGDVSIAADVSAATLDCDLIIHLAAVLTPACQDNPVRGAQINLIGTLNVFEAAREREHPRVLYMSSAGVFGPDDGLRPRPTTHYGAFKLAGEGCARAYFDDCGIKSLGLRPLVVYGPGRESGLTAGPTLACRAAAEGTPYAIGYSGPSDYLFVADLAAAFEAAIDAPLNGAEIHNLAGERADVDTLLAHIRAHEPGAEVSAAGPPIPVTAHIDRGTLREQVGGIPCTSLSEGLRRTIDFYRAAK